MLAHMMITGPQQRKAVSEGFALGLIVSGTQQLAWNKVAIDIAFPEAWHDWQHKGTFPWSAQTCATALIPSGSSPMPTGASTPRTSTGIRRARRS